MNSEKILMSSYITMLSFVSVIFVLQVMQGSQVFIQRADINAHSKAMIFLLHLKKADLFSATLFYSSIFYIFLNGSVRSFPQPPHVEKK